MQILYDRLAQSESHEKGLPQALFLILNNRPT